MLILLLGGLLDGLYLGSTRALEAQSADAFVYSEEANDSFFRSRLDETLRADVAAVDAVGSVSGLSVVQLPARVPGVDEPVDTAVFGYESANTAVPDPQRPVRPGWTGSLEDDGVEVGQTLGFGPARIPVEVAFVDDTTFNLQAAVWMDPTTWNGVVRANVPAATLAPGSSQALLVTSTNGSSRPPPPRSSRVEGVTALEHAILGLPGGATSGRSSAIITVTFVVAGLVVALFFALLTLERVGLFGVLKAIGSSSRIAAGLSLQAVLIALGAFVVGGLISLGLAAIIPAAIRSTSRSGVR